MTLRRRLALSLLALLALFSLNLVIFQWGDVARARCVEELRRAVERKTLVASIRRDIDDRLRHAALLSGIDMDGTFGSSPERLQEVRTELEEIGHNVRQLNELADMSTMSLVEDFSRTFLFLRNSIELFYANFGHPENHSQAILELSANTEPTGQEALRNLEAMEQNEARLVEAASRRFSEVSRTTSAWMVGILVGSAVLALVMGFLLYRHLAGELTKLKAGVASVAKGDFSHQIQVTTDDELGDLGKAFNSMSRNLLHTQRELRSTARELETRHQDVEKQRQVSLEMLHNILPAEVADELQNKGKVDPKYFEDVSILFLDFVGFTLAAEKLAAEELVQLLHDYFTTFDKIVERYQLEKLKTIGDAYMCAGGLPVRKPSHPVDIVMAAFEMIEAVDEKRRRGDGASGWGARIGIHTGPVIAGVVGIQKFAFDIWGDTVNFSSRMESSGEANRINLSPATYARVKDFFQCQKRGKVETKDGRSVEMYFAERLLPKLVGDGSQLPPAPFLRRYLIYFQKEPPAFPDFLADEQWFMKRQAS